jgi:hypothetical protein
VRSGFARRAAGWGCLLGIGLPPVVGFGLAGAGGFMLLLPGGTEDGENLIVFGLCSLILIPTTLLVLPGAFMLFGMVLEPVYNTFVYMRDTKTRQACRDLDCDEDDQKNETSDSLDIPPASAPPPPVGRAAIQSPDAPPLITDSPPDNGRITP